VGGTRGMIREIKGKRRKRVGGICKEKPKRLYKIYADEE
jgi:hypothetical protein